jgi:hypothetical protein
MNIIFRIHLQAQRETERVCRAPEAHDKGTKTHGKDFAVRFSSRRTAKGAR